MHQLASCFGPIEYFQPFVPAADGPALPPGHDTVRSSRMSERVWEVKWEHRDDCITALNVRISFILRCFHAYVWLFEFKTLKTIPHICASWTAQRPAAKGRTPTSPVSFLSRLHPGPEQSPHPRDSRSNHTCSQESSPDYRILKSPRHEPPSAASDVDFPSLNPSIIPRQPSLRDDFPLNERLRTLRSDDADVSSAGRVPESLAISSLDSAQTLISDSNDEVLDNSAEAGLKSMKVAQWSLKEVDSASQRPDCEIR